MTQKKRTNATKYLPKGDKLQTIAIRRRLEKHARTCTYFIFSGDRHCSCGRDQALQELEAIERVLGMEYDRKL